MGDRVPFSTIPGLVSPWLNEVITLIPTGQAYTVTNIFLQRNGHQAGDVVRGEFQVGAGAFGVTFSDGEATYSENAGLEVSSTDTLTFEFTQVDANSENLRGWFEIEGGVAITTQLTNLARVKRELGITGTTDDVLLNELVASVSEEIQAWLGYRVLATIRTDEPVDSIGTYLLALDQRPIISFSSLTENGTALVEGTDYESTAYDKKAGLVQRISGGSPVPWARGHRVVRVSYIHGFDGVPEEVAQAATELVALDYMRAQPGGKRLGLTDKVLDTGGSASYRSRDDVWGSQMKRLQHLKRM